MDVEVTNEQEAGECNGEEFRQFWEEGWVWLRGAVNQDSGDGAGEGEGDEFK